jgi:hypothetical protein
MSDKAMSLDDQLRQVRDAFYAARPQRPALAETPAEMWVEEVYPDYLIVNGGPSGSGFWRVPYTRDDDGVTIADRDAWQQVEQEYVPKALNDLTAVKSLGKNRIGGYLVLWGDDKRKDLSGEWFTPQTEGLLSVFKAVGKVPLLYHHGRDAKVGLDVVGAYDVMQPDEVGLWTEAQLDLAGQYRAAVLALAGKQALGQSSQTLFSARKVAPTGEIRRWVIVEGSLTPTPCEPRMIERPVSEIKAAYKSIGVEFPETPSDGAEEARARDAELETIQRDLLKIELEGMER